MSAQMKDFTVVSINRQTGKPLYAVALTKASSDKAAVARVLALHAAKDKALLDDTLVAIDAYSDLSEVLLTADGFDSPKHAIEVYEQYETKIVLQRRLTQAKAKTAVKPVRRSVAAVKAGKVMDASKSFKETIRILNRLDKTVDGFVASRAAPEIEDLDRVDVPAILADAEASKGPFKLKQRTKSRGRKVPVIVAPGRRKAPAKAAAKRKPAAKTKTKTKTKAKAQRA